MNTIRSTWIGWGSLCVAGGGAYYFAKKSINADRQTRHTAEQERKELQRRMEAAEYESRYAQPTKPKKSKKATDSDKDFGAIKSKGLDHAGSPSSESSQDAAPVGHAPETEGQKVVERSKYEASVPYRSRKGDRFS